MSDADEDSANPKKLSIAEALAAARAEETSSSDDDADSSPPVVAGPTLVAPVVTAASPSDAPLVRKFDDTTSDDDDSPPKTAIIDDLRRRKAAGVPAPAVAPAATADNADIGLEDLPGMGAAAPGDDAADYSDLEADTADAPPASRAPAPVAPPAVAPAPDAAPATAAVAPQPVAPAPAQPPRGPVDKPAAAPVAVPAPPGKGGAGLKRSGSDHVSPSRRSSGQLSPHRLDSYTGTEDESPTPEPVGAEALGLPPVAVESSGSSRQAGRVAMPKVPPPVPSGPAGSPLGAGDADGDEWDAANARKADEDAAAEAVRRAPPPGNVTWTEAYKALREEGLWKAHLGEISRVHKSVKTGGFWGACWNCWHNDIVEGTPMFEERDFILCLMKLPLDHGNALHRQILLTVHRLLVRPKRSDPDPPTTGPAWEKLGFQGDNPATDLRYSGMYGLLFLLWVVDFCPGFSGAMFDMASSKLQEFPFALVLLNFCGVALEQMTMRNLHDRIHAKWQATDPSPARLAREGGCTAVGLTVNEFAVGMAYLFYEAWRAEPTRRIQEFPPLYKEIQQKATAAVDDTCDKYVQVKTDFTRQRVREQKEAALSRALAQAQGKGKVKDAKFSEF